MDKDDFLVDSERLQVFFSFYKLSIFKGLFSVQTVNQMNFCILYRIRSVMFIASYSYEVPKRLGFDAFHLCDYLLSNMSLIFGLYDSDFEVAEFESAHYVIPHNEVSQI